MKAKTITLWVPALDSQYESKDNNAVGSSTWFSIFNDTTS